MTYVYFIDYATSYLRIEDLENNVSFFRTQLTIEARNYYKPEIVDVVAAFSMFCCVLQDIVGYLGTCSISDLKKFEEIDYMKDDVASDIIQFHDGNELFFYSYVKSLEEDFNVYVNSYSDWFSTIFELAKRVKDKNEKD